MGGSRRRAWAFLLGSSLPLAACQGPAPIDPEEASASSGTEEGSSEGSSGDAPIDVPAGCGNGIVEPEEECDLGFANAADSACTPVCTRSRCGDAIVAAGEACDEGEANGGPTCSESCTRPTRLGWSTTLAGSAHGWDVAGSMAPVAERSIAAVLFMDEDPYEVVIARYDADGTRPWATTLPTTTLRYYGLGAQLVPTGDDGVLLSIFADEADVVGSERVELQRLDAAGQTQWRHVVENSALGRPIAGRVTTAGEAVVLTAVIEIPTGELHTLVTRLDEEGSVLHERMIEAAVWRTAGVADGGFFAHTEDRLEAFDADDELVWSIPAVSSSLVSLAVDGDGGPVLTRRAPSGERLLEAYAADGRLRWDATLGLLPRVLAVGVDGSLAVVGTADAEPTDLLTNLDLAVEVFDAAGTQRWLERIDGPAHGEDEGLGVAIAADGAVWAAGDVSVPYESRDAWLGRFEEDPQ
jgi:hypothetical protein